MYMPRRTTEFREESRNDVSVGGTRRPTRSQIRMSAATPMSGKAAPPTNKRSSASRLAQPLCLERDRATQMYGSTPNRRLGSSVERTGPHHLDKKWVAERTQAIVEYLDAVHSDQPIPGVANDFFQRSGCLRQMTMKQFIGIVNFFFHNIWRNRVTVSSVNNMAAENIMSALTKLKYPHQINKSSLMTPTTQHSFGQIIVMLDFLMDLAHPPPGEIEEDEFPFMETAEQISMASDSTMSTTHTTHTNQTRAAFLLNEDLNAILFAHGADCFRAWDQRLMEKEEELKSNVRDAVIARKCGQQISDGAALENEIVSLVDKLQQVEQDMDKALDNKRLQQWDKLQQEQIQLENLIKANWENAKECKESAMAMIATCEQRNQNIQTLTDELKRLQEVVTQQKFTARQLNELQVHFTDRQNVNEAHKRSIIEGNERALNQQVMLARSKKNLLDKVELFNFDVRQIAQEQLQPQEDHLELSLSLKPQSDDLPERRRQLTQLAHQLGKRISSHQQQIQQLERQKHDYSLKTMELETEMSKLVSDLKAQEQQLAQLVHEYRNQRGITEQQEQTLAEQKYELTSRIGELTLAKDNATQSLEAKKEMNLQYLETAEIYQSTRIKARQDFCDAYEKQLDSAEKSLDTIDLAISQTKTLIEQSQQDLENGQLPSLDRLRSSLLE
ncbi:uncharacterized protein Dwil_GK19995 [Drosophila willistoni]|uniref:Kinetochore protein NDC80 n=1 Tax=Drosophila willistoni TaxID=7260 RepID=B4MSK7_DROWI|nr:restin homolog [Drosophila willistoni]EDW75096.1 uncharacterized protein Dwil_GK19995 [Drosophila willistoni]